MCITHRRRVAPSDSYSGTAGSSEEKHDDVRDLGKTLLTTQRFGFLATGNDDVREQRTEMEVEHRKCVLRTRE